MKDQPHKVKVITNGCVDAQAIIDSYYPAFKGVDVKECGINERCSLKELRKILDNASSAEEVMESLRRITTCSSAAPSPSTTSCPPSTT